jgi:DNA processing protein
MFADDLLYQIALTRVPQIGDVHAKILVQTLQTASAVFSTSKRQLEKIEGIGTVRAASIKSFTDFNRIETEIAFIEKYQIKPIFFNNPEYPQRLLNCYDSPAMLYYRGNTSLSAEKIISIVGTRVNSEYGKYCCEQLVDGLKDQSILIVSGLAFGIDAIAHKAALRFGLHTVGVLAHGLDRIYPAQHKSLARQMLEQGGLLTDFISGQDPDKQNFPRRNRITAGICDALVVIESGKKGGSLITAELGNGYNKDVFAFPGRITDQKSEGCIQLIKQNKAVLITNATDLLQAMQWDDTKKPVKVKQRSLFVTLSSDAQQILDLFKTKQVITIDDISHLAGLSSSSTASALLSLEMEGIIAAKPGKQYELL